jgi:hypothetical protein
VLVNASAGTVLQFDPTTLPRRIEALFSDAGISA